MNNQCNLRHIGITVSDLKKSAKFYKDIFQFKEIRFLDEYGFFLETVLAISQVHLNTLKLADRKGGIIELVEYKNPKAKLNEHDLNLIGCSHFALTVENSRDVYDQLCGKGVRTLSPPQLSVDGRAKVFFCSDPDGILIEVVEEL